MLPAPLRLDSYRQSVLHTKMTLVASLLKWANDWLSDVQDMDLAAAFDGLAHAKKIRRLAYRLEKTFDEAACAELLHAGTPVHHGDGYTALLRPGTDRKKWQHEAVMTDLIDATSTRLRGRFPHVPDTILRAIVTESMWQVHKTGRIDWRATDLRRAGIDPDLYSDRTPERPTIDLRGPATHAVTKHRPRGL